ncbi:MAG TPA: hypothetical protein VLZ11_00165 [Flavobacterium sp.]|nr:hypothetical protein [Flavobacterium sp.]
MKTKFLFLFLALGFLSCSSDDSGSTPIIPVGDNAYFPQDQGNYWVYDVMSEQAPASRDSLYINAAIEENGYTYYSYATENNMPLGFYSRIMTSGKSRNSGSRVLISGTMNAGDIFGGNLGELEVNFNNFLFFDASATSGKPLDSKSDSFNFLYNDIDFKIDYILSTTAGQSFPTHTIGDVVYENIKTTTLSLKAKITATVNLFGVEIPYVIMNQQDIILSTQYYAKNVGVIFVDTKIEYHLNELPIPDVELPVPQDFESSSSETLDIFYIQPSAEE